jgi:hypothetical protein
MMMISLKEVLSPLSPKGVSETCCRNVARRMVLYDVATSSWNHSISLYILLYSVTL